MSAAEITAIIIFFTVSLYAFYDYYKTENLKDLLMGVVLFIGAIATFVQSLNTSDQADNIEKLSKLDTSLSYHIDTLVTIDTGLSRKSNDLENQSIQLANKNQELIANVQSLTENQNN